MKNVQISFDDNLLDRIDRYASSVRVSRSAIVKEAMERWLIKLEIQEFEREWIKKLKEVPQDIEDLDAWSEVEYWEKE